MGAHYVVRTNVVDYKCYYALAGRRPLLGGKGVDPKDERERKFHYKDEALRCRDELRQIGLVAAVYPYGVSKERFREIDP